MGSPGYSVPSGSACVGGRGTSDPRSLCCQGDVRASISHPSAGPLVPHPLLRCGDEVTRHPRQRRRFKIPCLNERSGLPFHSKDVTPPRRPKMEKYPGKEITSSRKKAPQ